MSEYTGPRRKKTTDPRKCWGCHGLNPTIPWGRRPGSRRHRKIWHEQCLPARAKEVKGVE